MIAMSKPYVSRGLSLGHGCFSGRGYRPECGLGSPSRDRDHRRPPREHDPRPRPRLRPARRRDGRRPVGRERRARLVRAAQDGDGRVRRGPDPLPDARPARLAVRAQRLPLPHPLPDLRGARMVSPSHRLLQRVQHEICEGDRRLLRPGGGGRPQPGRQARRLQLRARLRRARRGDPGGAPGASTTRPSRPTSGSSRRASPASSPGP